ncbi:GAF domain-containing protein [Kocuria oceani]|uniref:GAF domain-containing protein n=1 Tax=Kocuria oceani TaxID=988827 RepID=A0ABV9TFY0_9MICC|nr:GAF domain-containing protein [Kocuria oceani]
MGAAAEGSTTDPLLRLSWARSLSHLAAPERCAPRVVLDRTDLREAGAPLRALLPVLDELLTPLAEDTGLVVAVTDPGGVLLRVRGSAQTRRRAEDMGFLEGADWSEHAVGTNAPGTALVLRRPVTVHREQHFYPEARPWSCTAAPLLHPLTGELLGAVDLTGGDAAADPATRALIGAAVRAARAELALALRREPPARGPVPAPASAPFVPPLTAPPAAPAARLRVLGGAPPALVVAGRALELTERHAEILLALSRAGAGLSTAELSARLWDGRAQEATVRAEVLRLRRLLDSRGGPVIASRPYRLCAPLPSDAGRVLELLDRGSHRRALREYTGALLPHSEAPAVVALRHRLSGLLREAVLTDGSAEAVRQYLELPEAADDAEAWALLLRLLPARSPARARAVLELERLRD